MWHDSSSLANSSLYACGYFTAFCANYIFFLVGTSSRRKTIEGPIYSPFYFYPVVLLSRLIAGGMCLGPATLMLVAISTRLVDAPIITCIIKVCIPLVIGSALLICGPFDYLGGCFNYILGYKHPETEMVDHDELMDQEMHELEQIHSIN